MNPSYKAGMDIAALVALLGWVGDALPAIATLLTAIWSALRIYDSWLDLKVKRAKLLEQEKKG